METPLSRTVQSRPDDRVSVCTSYVCRCSASFHHVRKMLWHHGYPIYGRTLVLEFRSQYCPFWPCLYSSRGPLCSDEGLRPWALRLSSICSYISSFLRCSTPCFPRHIASEVLSCPGWFIPRAYVLIDRSIDGLKAAWFAGVAGAAGCT